MRTVTVQHRRGGRGRAALAGVHPGSSGKAPHEGHEDQLKRQEERQLQLMKEETANRIAVGAAAIALILLAGCAREAADSPDTGASRSTMPPGVQAISFRGDTLREFPLAPATRTRYEQQLAEA